MLNTTILLNFADKFLKLLLNHIYSIHIKFVYHCSFYTDSKHDKTFVIIIIIIIIYIYRVGIIRFAVIIIVLLSSSLNDDGVILLACLFHIIPSLWSRFYLDGIQVQSICDAASNIANIC